MPRTGRADDHRHVYLSKTDGTQNGRALRTVKEVFGADYHDERALTEGEWPAFQIVVEDEDYNGKTYRKVKWFNRNHAEPPGMREPNSEAKSKASARFRELFAGGAPMPADPFGDAPPAPPAPATDTERANEQLDMAAEGGTDDGACPF